MAERTGNKRGRSKIHQIDKWRTPNPRTKKGKKTQQNRENWKAPSIFFFCPDRCPSRGNEEQVAQDWFQVSNFRGAYYGTPKEDARSFWRSPKNLQGTNHKAPPWRNREREIAREDVLPIAAARAVLGGSREQALLLPKPSQVGEWIDGARTRGEERS